MGKILVYEFVSLDGSYEDPSFTFEYGFPAGVAEALGELTGSSTAILLGRNTFQMFAPAWSTRTAEDDPGAPFFNDSPKYVVSSTLDSGDEWSNIYLSGSGQLVRALPADELVDELHMLVYPMVLGSGERLFPDGMARPSSPFSRASPSRTASCTSRTARPAEGTTGDPTARRAGDERPDRRLPTEPIGYHPHSLRRTPRSSSGSGLRGSGLVAP